MNLNIWSAAGLFILTLFMLATSALIGISIADMQNSLQAKYDVCGREFQECRQAIPCCGNSDFKKSIMNCNYLAHETCELLTNENESVECMCAIV